MLVFIGGYTEPDRNGRGHGIYVYRMDATTGQLEQLRVIPGVANPSFLAIDPRGRVLYAVNGGEENGVSAFSVNRASGELALLNRRPSEGENPAHVAANPSGSDVAIANFSGGTVALFPVEPDGRLGPPSDVVQHSGPLGAHPIRQDRTHPHQIFIDPGGPFALVNDLGLDRTLVYRLDVQPGKLTPNDPPFLAAAPGAGPRHLDLHPTRRFVYILNEIDSTIQACTYDGTRGELSPIERVSTLPAGFGGQNSTAQIVVHPNGRFVYASNRGHDSIATFSIELATGRLAPLGHTATQGRSPRNFNLDPSGRFLLVANQDSDTVIPFHVDVGTGGLKATGQVISAGSPSCVVFLA